MTNPFILRAVGLVLLGAVTIWGVMWQYRVIKNDIQKFRNHLHLPIREKIEGVPARIKAGIWLCLALYVGVIVRGIIAIHFDPRSYFTYGMMFSDLGIVIGFSIPFLFQLYFSPVVTTFALVMSAYYFFEYQEIYVLPIVQSTVDLLASIGPDWTENTYTVILGTFSIAATLKDTVRA